ncbi:MAG TPA: hypothetical protein PK825_05175 [Bacteroidales bacterium]|nr:hypothetical protein [Bacteroidales bacterium]
MKTKQISSVLTVLIAILSGIAAFEGIHPGEDSGISVIRSVRGQDILLYGKGLYRHMSADVAIQGIAQDYVTLFIGIPLLLLSLWLYRRGHLKGQILLTGITSYFMVTYVFYLCMAMYNELFLMYVLLAGISFYSFLLLMIDLAGKVSAAQFSGRFFRKLSGWFLMVNALLIASLWLKVVLLPLVDGMLYPAAVQHYTTLIVQGLDLAILLPGSAISGILLLKNKKTGYLYAPIYLVFLCLMMTALLAKIIGMSLHGVPAGPAIVIIPLITLFTVGLTFSLLRSTTDSMKTSSIQNQ